MLESGGDDGGETADGCQAREPRVSDDVSPFVSVKPLGIFDETVGHFPAVFAATITVRQRKILSLP